MVAVVPEDEETVENPEKQLRTHDTVQEVLLEP